MSDNENSIQNIQKKNTEMSKGQGTGKIFLILLSVFAILFSIYAAIYIAGDHEHIITVTSKNMVDGTSAKYYYIYAVNEEGKECKYEIGSRWISGRKGATDKDVWEQIREGHTYHVRATGLCWGFATEPLLSPITTVSDGSSSYINDIKNSSIILIFVFVIAILAVVSLTFFLDNNFTLGDKLIRRKPEYRRAGLSGIGLFCVFGLFLFVQVFHAIIVKIADMYYMY